MTSTADPSLRVPYTDFAAQFVEEREGLLAAIERVLDRGDFILGRAVREFEERFAALCECSSAVGVGSGTDALVLAMRALGIGPGDEVITPPNSWISSASSIALCGALPVFADVASDLNIDPEQVESAVTPNTKAIMPVHLTGRPARMDALKKIAERRGLRVVEDAAQSAGARYQNRAVGGLGDIGCFSTHPLKNLNACGDGGVVTTSDPTIRETLRLLRNHGLADRDHSSYWGYCSRLDSIQAAILVFRMDGLKQVEERRRQNAAYYNEALADVVVTPTEGPGEHHVYHTYVIQTPERDALKAHLETRGVSSKVHYPVPIHLQEASKHLGYGPGDFPVTERLSREILTLPVHQYLTDAQREHVAASVLSFFGRS